MTPSAATGLQCFTGLVNIPPSTLLGATSGTLRPFFGSPLAIRQVIVPSALNGVPLTQLNGRIADVCGNFVVDRGRLVLNVVFARPTGSTSATFGATGPGPGQSDG